MKRKMYLAVLALCVALTASACGSSASTAKEPTETKTEQEAKTDKEEKKAPKDTDTRLVTVDNLEKYVTLGEYKGITLDNTVNVITDEDLQARIDRELTEGAEEVNEPAQNGDIVTINFVGTKDGVAFNGGTANNYDLTLGEGRMIEGFEEGIVGMKKGETKDLDLTFPEEYPAEDLAGQPVVFKITCQKVSRKAELTDEWVAKNTEQKTVDEYRTAVKTEMEEDAKKSALNALKMKAWNQVVEASEVIEYPAKDLENAVAEFKKMIGLYAEQAGMDLEKFIETQQMTMEQFDEQANMYAENKVKQILIVQAILDAEGLSLADEECLAIQDELIEDSGVKDLAALIDQYGQVMVDESIGLLRVENFIVDNAEINEQVANGDTTAANAEGAAEADNQTPDEENAVDEELEEEQGEAGAEDDTVEISDDEETTEE